MANRKPDCSTIEFSTSFGLPLSEVKGSPQESFTPEGIKVKRIFDVPWSERWRYVYGFLGGSLRARAPQRFDPDGNPLYYVKRFLPHSHKVRPRAFKDVKVYASSIDSIEGVSLVGQQLDAVGDAGLDIDDTSSLYERARLTVNYEHVPYAHKTDEEVTVGNIFNFEGNILYPDESTLKRYVTKIVQPSAEALTLPHGSYRWVDDAKKDGGILVLGSHAIIISTAEITYIWHKVPGRPTAAHTHLGTVNKRSFDGYPPGTLLLLAVDVKPYRQVTGVRAADITYKMKYFSAIDPNTGKNYNPPRGHNFFLQYFSGSLVAPEYKLITDTGLSTGRKVYAEKDFTSLFNPNENVMFRDDEEE